MIEFFTQNPQILIMVIFLWCGLGIIIENGIAEKYTQESLIWLPEVLYTDAKMNWFGSWFCFIFLIIIDPFGFLLKLGLYLLVGISYVGEFIKWLFTVGRKDEDEDEQYEDEDEYNDR